LKAVDAVKGRTRMMGAPFLFVRRENVQNGY
jgi:hypothetical protein